MAAQQPMANPFAGAPPDNPFAAAPSPSGPTTQTGNPFDPMAPPPQDPFATQTAPPSDIVPEPGAGIPASNPFAPPTQQQPMQNPYQQQAAPQQPQPVPPETQPIVGNPPFGAQQPAQANAMASTALVPSQQPSNPYGGLVPPQQQGQVAYGAPQSQAVVPAAQQNSQWAVPSSGGAGGATFDPFAPPPAPVPAAAPPPAPVPVPAAAPPPAPVSQELVVTPWEQGPASQYQLPPETNLTESASVAPPFQDHGPGFGGGRSVASEPETPANHRSTQEMIPFQQPGENNTTTQQIVNSPQTKYGRILAQNAPPGASPLPKAELVRKTGFILARVSFRTIVMKKWKQAFWIQYGPHTMIWFRTQEDFNDWLNNPYHTQSQRNFLIKLAVNFVHDLYRPNVRGYQVTQSRTKNYGRKTMKQFKLERWMDYGPTIAAAFASHDPKEVDALREAIVECMRNTPQDSGIRATGAVRQNHGNGEHHHEYQYDSDHHGAHHDDYDDGSHYSGSYAPSYAESSRGHRQSSQDLGYQGGSERTMEAPDAAAAAAPAPVADLLDFSSDPAPAPAQPAAAPPPAAGNYHYAAAGQPQPPTQQYPAAGQPQPPAQQYAAAGQPQPPQQYYSAPGQPQPPAQQSYAQYQY